MEIAHAAVAVLCRQGRRRLLSCAAAAATAVRGPSASTFACPAHWARRPFVPSLPCLSAAIGKQGSAVRLFVRPAPRSHGRRPLRVVTSDYVPFDRFDRTYQGFRQQPEDRRQRRRRSWLIAGGVALGIGWYYVAHLETVPLTGRRRFLSVTPRQEEAMARAAYQEIMNNFGRALVHPSHPYSRMVRKVALDLVKVSGMKDLDWEVYVVNSPERNAFVLPGGKIFVFTGILPVCADEDGLAAVLGHEIAHQLARHSAEKFSYLKFLLLLQVMLGFFVDPGFIFNQIILNLGFLLPFSRKCELEADQIGLTLMAQACYDPKAAVGIWQRMAQTDRKQPLQYLSTHPGHETRLRNLEKWLPDAEKLREESDCSAELYDLASMVRVLNVPRW